MFQRALAYLANVYLAFSFSKSSRTKMGVNGRLKLSVEPGRGARAKSLGRAAMMAALAAPMLVLAGPLAEGTAHAQGVELASPITTFAGNGTAGFSGDGGPATAAEINAPEGLAFDNRGNVYIADYYNNRIRVVTAAGVISTFAGGVQCPNPTATSGACGDGGPVSAATFYNPAQIQFDNAEIFSSPITPITEFARLPRPMASSPGHRSSPR